MSNELLNISCKGLRDRIAAGQVKSVEAVEAVFEALEKYEPTVGSFISTLEEKALAKAAEVDNKISAGEKTGKIGRAHV